MIEAAPESNRRQQFTRFGLGLCGLRRAVRAEKFEGHDHILEGGQCRDQMEALKDEADSIRPQRCASIFVEGRKRSPGELDLSARRPVESGEQPEERRLPATRWAQNDDDFARRDV